MRSSTLIVSYLLRDTCSRWREQPSSLLARLFVGLLLAGLATVVLVAFTLLERSVRERLDRFGLNTLVVREMVGSTDPELIVHGPRPDPLAVLDQSGERLRLRQLFPRASTEFEKNLPVIVYSPDAIGPLAPYLSEQSPFVCLSESLPEFTQVRVGLEDQTLTAVSRAPGDLFQPLGINSAVLVPKGTAADMERFGYIDITRFERRAGAGVLPMTQYVDAVNQFFRLERQRPPQVQSALPMIRELEDLQSRQQKWRALLAGGLGLTLALVYGAIAIFEFRQNLYITALLRSLGASRTTLYLRQWIENGFVANLAAVAAIGTVALFHTEIFSAFGFSPSVTTLEHGNPYRTGEIALILVWINVGAFLSSLPVAFGLRRPVGMVLN